MRGCLQASFWEVLLPLKKSKEETDITFLLLTVVHDVVVFGSHMAILNPTLGGVWCEQKRGKDLGSFWHGWSAELMNPEVGSTRVSLLCVRLKFLFCLSQFEYGSVAYSQITISLIEAAFTTRVPEKFWCSFIPSSHGYSGNTDNTYMVFDLN